MKKFIASAILLVVCCALQAQVPLSGTVHDQHSNPLPDVTVRLKNSYLLSSTNAYGQFEINVPSAESWELIFSLIGFSTDTVSVVFTDTPIYLQLEENRLLLPPAQILGLRNSNRNPISNTKLTAEEVQANNLAQDMPYLLRFTPSAVVTSDAGNGVGYTGIRIRGSDPSRINVTINGIPLNDSESQAVFWVNLPDFASSVSSIDIQRGVGSSTNGTGAFGASVNINGSNTHPQAFANLNSSFGSFNTFKNTVQWGSGLIDERFSLQGRLSQISSDGFVDRASSLLRSYYLSGMYLNDKTSLNAVMFGGYERTYQSWYGTPQSRIENDTEGMLQHAANNGYSDAQLQNLLQSGRSYNYYLYENEVDNYNQNHYQLHLNHRFNSAWKLQLAAHYTKGFGYFEQFREQDALSDYGLTPSPIASNQLYSNGVDEEGNPINTDWPAQFNDNPSIYQEIAVDENGNAITDSLGNTLLNLTAINEYSDIIRRRWLDNDFYGLTYSLQRQSKRLHLIFGGALNRYDGRHFGEIIWAEQAPMASHHQRFYENTAIKNDGSGYVQADYKLNSRWTIYADLQLRNIAYKLEGFDIDRRNLQLSKNYVFFNPKTGIHWQINQKHDLSISYGIANREPVRSDFTDAGIDAAPLPERLHDLELGWSVRTTNYQASLTFYNMQYTDQLVLTGALNDVGSPLRTNVKNSYRRGVELEYGIKLSKGLAFMGAVTFSSNQIQNFEEVIYDYSEENMQIRKTTFGTTPIAYSPDMIASAQLVYKLKTRGNWQSEIAIMPQYVSKQYLDNSGNEERIIDAYLVNDARISLSKNRWSLQIQCNNFLDAKYSSNGYTYSYYYGDLITENFYYPQAGRNFMFGVEWRIE
jgi:iron complex outermembrane receptor protein